jgi:beta-glucosidase
MSTPFPANFLWGAATAAYQIEGSPCVDGRGATVWDAFVRQPGRIWSAHHGEIACDHYRRWPEDVALLRQLGLGAYRFSLAWTRLLPEGDGAPSPAGLDHYDRLIDALLEAGIEPWVTLHHWDYPLALHRRGGWLNPDSPRWFADYAALAATRYGDRVAGWFTHNEPQCFVGVGLQEGRHAPGLQLGLADVLLASHHVLLSHGRAVQALRARVSRPGARLGWAPIGHTHEPASESPADIAAARTATFATTSDSMKNAAWWSDPVYLGRYPADALTRFAPALPPITDEDLRVIAQPLDFIGFNFYTAEATVRAAKDGSPVIVADPPGFPLTHMRAPVKPGSLRWAARFHHERYGGPKNLPVLIAENGLSSADWVAGDGAVHDDNRIDFIGRYLSALRQAGSEGVPLAGYFHWSLLDNFEWAQGYQHRFGLVHVDFATQCRTIKRSGHWFAEIARSHGARL